MRKKKFKLISVEKLFRGRMKDPEFRHAYEDLEPEFQIAKAVIEARIKKGLTQEKLAKKMGTKQPVISRLEGMDSLPTVSQLKKLAEALGKRLIIRFA